MTHSLKTIQPYFDAVVDGTKRFELRKDDRGYKVGDKLILREWNKRKEQYTGRYAVRKVNYLLRGPFADGLGCGWVILQMTKPSSSVRRQIVSSLPPFVPLLKGY